MAVGRLHSHLRGAGDLRHRTLASYNVSVIKAALGVGVPPTARNTRDMPERDQPPPPTLGQIQREACWLWICCADPLYCMHRRAVAVAPFVIRYGPDTSSDVLRKCARCTACGRLGATLQHPSWIDRETGFGPLPAEDEAQRRARRQARPRLWTPRRAALAVIRGCHCPQLRGSLASGIALAQRLVFPHV